MLAEVDRTITDVHELMRRADTGLERAERLEQFDEQLDPTKWQPVRDALDQARRIIERTVDDLDYRLAQLRGPQ